MKWISDVLVDLIVTVCIVAGVYLETEWLQWVIIGYTALMVLAKGLVLIGDSSLQIIRKAKNNAPDWFPHLLYAINVSVLLLGQWWLTAVGWLLIWILSYVAQRRLQGKTRR